MGKRIKKHEKEFYLTDKYQIISIEYRRTWKIIILKYLFRNFFELLEQLKIKKWVIKNDIL